MGRTLKRVPLDFDWPQGKIWPGYMVSFETLILEYNKDLSFEERSKLEVTFGRIMGCEIRGNEDFQYPKYHFLEPPTGDGYQLWETTTEGSPDSPVFATLDELCAWCAENATTFADHRATAQEWKKMLSEDFVHAQMGNIVMM